MKISKRRKLASRANGALSKGPKTAEGKLSSSYNAVRHGLLSKCVVLACEEEEAFKKLVEQFIRRFEPLDDVEFGMVEEMAACYWRTRRGWAAETELLNQAVEKHSDGTRTATACIAAAFTDLAANPEFALLSRYEGRLNRMYQRALHNLLLLLRANKIAAAQPLVDAKGETPAESSSNKNDRTNLIPVMNTPLQPAPAPSSPVSGRSLEPEGGSPGDLAA